MGWHLVVQLVDHLEMKKVVRLVQKLVLKKAVLMVFLLADL